MCGRYRLSRRKQIIEDHFDCDPWDDDWSPRYNIAPTQPVPVVRQHPKEQVCQISLMKWGLIPADGFYEWLRHEAACVIVRRAPPDRTCHPIGSTLRGMAFRKRIV